MADDNKDEEIFGRDAAEVAQDIGAAALALAAAVASGAVIRANQVIAIADRAGTATIPVSSTCIASLSYALISGDMEVTFVDGSVYHYPQVHMADFLRFLNARSKGSHYNQFFRGKEELIQGKKKGSHMILGGQR